MVEMYEENIEGIQVIHAVPAGQYQQQLPTIFFYHGFLSSKEMYSYFGYTLAKAGFRVILPDALMHGARAESDEAKCVAHFWRILQNNVEELAMLKELFVGRGLADPQRLGVGGVSMGGMTTMAALVKYPWVKVAANLMGSGYFSRLSHHLFLHLPPVTQHSATFLNVMLLRYLAWMSPVKRHYSPINRCLSGTASRTTWCRLAKACGCNRNWLPAKRPPI